MTKWLEDRDMYLHELIRLDGCGDQFIVCRLCQLLDPKYRCKECFGGEMFCGKCLVELHACMPFHHIEVGLFLSLMLTRLDTSRRFGLDNFSNGRR